MEELREKIYANLREHMDAQREQRMHLLETIVAQVEENATLTRENARLQRQLDVRAGGVSYYIKAMCEVEKERDTIMADAVKVSSENEELRAAYADAQSDFRELRAQLDVCESTLDDSQREVERLQNTVATLQSQESFRTALLESVVSAARATLAEYKDYDIRSADIIRSFDPLADALAALDEWQAEAPPAAPAEAKV